MSTSRNKIIFIASSAPRFEGDGTAPFILNMAQDLCDLGWDVDILAPHAPGLKKYEKICSVDIYRFRYFFPARFQTLCYQGGVAGNLRKSKFRALQIPFFALAEAVALFGRARRGSYDLIHSHWLIPQGYIGQKIAKWYALPHIVSVHGTDIFGFRQRLILPFKKAAIKNSAAVIANSNATKAEVQKIYQNDNIPVIPTGTTPRDEKLTSSLSRRDFCNDDCRLIVFLGRLVEEKGLEYLIRALPMIREKQDVKLLVIGDGPERQTLENLARELCVDDDIIFTGAVSHVRIYDYLSLGDFFVGPSISLKSGGVEAQGNTFIEAMFARLPVVASDIGGISDAVIHEHTGLLVKEKSPDEIAAAVLRLLDDPSLAKKLAENGHKHAHAFFSRYSTAQKISALYRNILGKRGDS